MKIKHTVFIIFLSVIFTGVSAEVLLVERTQQQHDQPLPKQGQTMQQVEQQFGAPLARQAAVGEPPIARWEYSDYVVYFERNLVLNTVFKHIAQNDN